jgi:transcriptional regulator CtsR
VALRRTDELGRSEFDLSPYKRESIQAEMLKRILRSLALS